MISTDFASNEHKDDAFLAIKLLFQPWRWKTGKNIEKARQIVKRKFFRKDESVHLFLTGRSSLYYCLQTLKLPQDAEVIVQAFTCEAVILPILESNLKPVYADIDEKTLSMAPQQFEAKITSQTKVVIFQHTFGLTPQREEIIKIAKKHNVMIIEDVAHGFDTNLFKNDTFNTVKLLSFGRSKTFSSVFGGAIVTSDKTLAKKLAKIEKKLLFPVRPYILQLLMYKPLSVLIRATYGIFLGRILHRIINTLRLLPKEISRREKEGKFDHMYARAYPNALAILLVHQLEKFNKTAKIRSQRCKEYSEYFKKSEQFGKQWDTQQSLIRFPLFIPNKQLVVNQARKSSLFLGTWYNQAVDPKPLNLHKVMYEKGMCPIAEKVCEHIINLPTNITENESKKALSILEKVYKTSIDTIK